MISRRIWVGSMAGFLVLPLGWVALARPGESVPGLSHRVQFEKVAAGSWALGELRAASSALVTSRMRGREVRILWLTNDGAQVKEGEVVARLDSSAARKDLEDCRAAVERARAQLEAAEQGVRLEETESGQSVVADQYELDSERLKLQNLQWGEGPLELGKLENAWSDARAEATRWKNYLADLRAMAADGLDPGQEIDAAKRKADELTQKEEVARQSFESYRDFAYPSKIREGELAVARAEGQVAAAAKAAGFSVAKAAAEVRRGNSDLGALVARCADLEMQLSAAEVRAPSSGLAVLRETFNSTPPRKLQVGDQAFEGMPLLEVPDTSAMQVEVLIREVDLPLLRVGQDVEIVVEALAADRLAGKLISVGVLATAPRGETEKFFRGLVAVAENDLLLRPGMTARTLLVREAREGVLAVPPLFVRREGDALFVQRRGWLGPRRREVKVGLEGAGLMEVRSGLKAGDEVVAW